MTNKFNHLVLGGTFDLLHQGHKSLIDFACKNAKKVTIGLTSQEMVLRNKKKPSYFGYEKRLDQLKNYIRSKNYSKVQTVKIDDIYGVALKDKTIDGIVVSKDTMPGASAINAKRTNLQLPQLKILIVPTVFAKDHKEISTSRILAGEISREGEVYALDLKDRNFLLPEKLRITLGKPFGKIVKDEIALKKILDQAKKKLVCVGDEVTRTLLRIGVKIDLAIVDFKINRQKMINNFPDLGILGDVNVNYVKSARGTISLELIDTISNYFQKGVGAIIIKVDGEEDLAVIPVILLSPLGTLIIYGQRNVGAIVVTVDEKLKEKTIKLLKQFKTF